MYVLYVDLILLNRQKTFTDGISFSLLAMSIFSILLLLLLSVDLLVAVSADSAHSVSWFVRMRVIV